MTVARSPQVRRAPARDVIGSDPIVVLAPHPDDETLGCGGILATAFQHAGAHVICMTDGSASHPGSAVWPPARLAELRRQELAEAIRRLGGCKSDLTWLGLRDGALATCDPHPIAERIAGICHLIGADRILSASPLDHHADHKATAAIALRVAALCSGMRLFFYPVWSRWDDPGFEAAHGAWTQLRPDITTHRKKKAHALAAHRSQLGLVVSDAPDGFCLDPKMVRQFSEEDELYFEVI